MKTLNSETIKESQQDAEKVMPNMPVMPAKAVTRATPDTSAATNAPGYDTGQAQSVTLAPSLQRVWRSHYIKSIPADATSHQLSKVARAVHEILERDLDDLLAVRPDYQILATYTGHLKEAVSNLDFVFNARVRKSPQDTRPIGGQPYDQDKNLSEHKREIYQRRRSQMRRLRSHIKWQLNDPDLDAFPEDMPNEDLKAAEILHSLVIKRIKDFESGSYEESHIEFEHLFKSIDDSGEAQAALRQLKLDRVYANLKRHNQALEDILDKQTSYEAQMAKLPRMIEVERELRRVLRALFTFMNFDLETGSKTFKSHMAHFTAMFARVDVVAQSRETRKENNKLARAIDSEANDPDAHHKIKPTAKCATKFADGTDDRTDRTTADPADISGPHALPVPLAPPVPSDPACPSDLSCAISKPPDQSAHNADQCQNKKDHIPPAGSSRHPELDSGSIRGSGDPGWR